MSDPTALPPPTGDEALPEGSGEALQFDQAEFDTPAGSGPACTLCKQPIVDQYCELNGKVLCARCRQGIEAAFRGGSRFGRAIKALVLGSIAAVVGAVIYYAIMRATGWNLGIVAVVVGLMVGGAVRKGSGNRGGLGYQFLALFLTYSAIAAMLTPTIFEAISQRQKEDAAQQRQQIKAVLEKVERDRAKAKAKTSSVDDEAKAQKAKTAPTPVPPGAASTPVVASDDNEEGASEDAVILEELPEMNGPLLKPAGYLRILLAWTVLAYVIPVIAAYSSPISGLIFAFALWEAWKINRRLVLVFNGPFRLGTADSVEPVPKVIDDEP